MVQGTKTWEIRGSATTVRGCVAIAEIKSKALVGSVHILGCHLIRREDFHLHTERHQVTDLLSSPAAFYKKIYAWELGHPVEYDAPVPWTSSCRTPIWIYFKESLGHREGKLSTSGNDTEQSKDAAWESNSGTENPRTGELAANDSDLDEGDSDGIGQVDMSRKEIMDADGSSGPKAACLAWCVRTRGR